jgi:hypothetical protein
MSHKHADSLQHDAIDETVNSFILKRGRRYRGGGGGGGGGVGVVTPPENALWAK